MIKDHLDKNNLHHAYLIEGKKEDILPPVVEFIESIGVKIEGNPDFNQITLDSFKIDDARNLKSQSIEKGISKNKNWHNANAGCKTNSHPAAFEFWR